MNTESVATGSTAEISAPNSKQVLSDIYPKACSATPVASVATMVPSTCVTR